MPDNLTQSDYRFSYRFKVPEVFKPDKAIEINVKGSPSNTLFITMGDCCNSPDSRGPHYPHDSHCCNSGSVYVRRYVRSLLGRLASDAEVAGDVELIIGELCTNVERHVCSTEGVYYASLCWTSSLDSFYICVKDFGLGFDPNALSAPGEERHDRVGGYGIPIIKGLCESVTFSRESDGMKVDACYKVARKK